MSTHISGYPILDLALSGNNTHLMFATCQVAKQPANQPANHDCAHFGGHASSTPPPYTKPARKLLENKIPLIAQSTKLAPYEITTVPTTVPTVPTK